MPDRFVAPPSPRLPELEEGRIRVIRVKKAPSKIEPSRISVRLALFFALTTALVCGGSGFVIGETHGQLTERQALRTALREVLESDQTNISARLLQLLIRLESSLN